MTLFYQSKKWFQLLSLQWWWVCGSLSACSGEFERLSQWFWIRGEYRITWGAAINYLLMDAAQDQWTQTVLRDLLIQKKLPRWFCCILQGLWSSLWGWGGDPMPSVTGSQGKWWLIWGLCRSHHCKLVTGRTLLTLNHWIFEVAVHRGSLHVLSCVTI